MLCGIKDNLVNNCLHPTSAILFLVINEPTIYISNYRLSIIILMMLVDLILPTTLKGQRQKIIFEHLSLEQELSQNSAQSILQDSCGFIWIRAQEGLNKYDGITGGILLDARILFRAVSR